MKALLILSIPLLMGASCSQFFGEDARYFYCSLSAEHLEISEMTITLKDFEAKKPMIICEESAVSTEKGTDAAVRAP